MDEGRFVDLIEVDAASKTGVDDTRELLDESDPEMREMAEDEVAALESDPPYGARVTISAVESGPGWDAPAVAPWLETALGLED
mgnify:CR=1 FL=1